MEDLDKFKGRKTDIKRLEDGFDIRPIQHIITHVVQFLMFKALHEKRPQDKFNPAYLGNVSFYIDNNEITKETRLHFDKDPRTWDQKTIMADLLEMESEMMMEKEADGNMLDMDNPFRY